MEKSSSQQSQLDQTQIESESTSAPQKKSKSRGPKTKVPSREEKITVSLTNTHQLPTFKTEVTPRLTKKGELIHLAEQHGVNPFEFMLLVIKGDFKSLGYESDKILQVTPTGVMEKEVLPMELRVACAKEAAQYLYPKKKSIEVSGNNDADPISVVADLNFIDIIKKARGVN